ncbi:hypothetical protein MKX01_005581 [Papaver californicum]|nr:hypothetical protein MKX01_005581 [Papaver californicum]
MDVEKPFFVTTCWSNFTRPSYTVYFLILTVISISILQISSKSSVFPLTWVIGSSKSESETKTIFLIDPGSCSWFYKNEESPRKMVMSIRDFGGIEKLWNISKDLIRMVVHQLNVPEGRWVTGSFNLTSNFTLFLEFGAVILGSQNPEEWPVIEALPSYGRGNERLGGRHISLIHGDSLSNVVITGGNGTIDGQGSMWWDLWWNRKLEHTRGHLVELMNSHNILISNLTFHNSPFWTIHPVYCSDVVIKGMTILAPLNSPNTDGIDPDSSTNVCIEDCYIESGDDLVAVKSGWDQYGIKMARPSSNIVVRKVSGTTPTCSGVGIGSEMSGGIFNVHIESLHIRNSAAGVQLKTDIGRGGYITNITITNISLDRVKIPFSFSRGANDHPDDGWDPKALPSVKGIYISNLVSIDTIRAPLLEGIEDSPFEGICMKNISLLRLRPSLKWQCEFVKGLAVQVSPEPCQQLVSDNNSSSWCQNS